jgi:hypothetical protein
MSALGVPVDIARGDALSRFQFYLDLPDGLFFKEHPQSAHLKELADSFSHDVLNLAALAGRMLWYEGVTPDTWRSHDLIAVSVDLEAYYVMLQSACDIMADVIVTLGVPKKGQAPSDSFHRLHEWASKNPNRLEDGYRELVGQTLTWFDEINSERTRFVHRGKTPLVYTDRVSFNWGKLLPSLRKLTEELLGFSVQLARVINPGEEWKNSAKMRVIDGVYVPALYHLLHKYETPKESPDLIIGARSLAACGGYVEAAYFGYPDGFWWKMLLLLSKALGSGPVAGNVPVGITGLIHDCKFLFSQDGHRYGFIACDRANDSQGWLAGATKSAQKWKADYSAEKVAFVVQQMKGVAPERLPDTDISLLVDNDPQQATKRLIAAFAG